MSLLKQANPLTQLAHEHRVLLSQHGKLQRRWTELARAHRQEVAQLQAQLMQLRAQLLVKDSTLLWEREDRATLPANAPAPPAAPCPSPDDMPLHWLTRGLLAVDWVICQTGCISHGGHWREDEHCRRLGRTCLQVTHPDAMPWDTPASGDAIAQHAPLEHVHASHVESHTASTTPLPPLPEAIAEETPGLDRSAPSSP